MRTSDEDFYYEENGKIVLKAAFHIRRGVCCGNNCRHCPYTKPCVKDNAELEEEYQAKTEE